MKIKIGKKTIKTDLADNSIQHFFGLSFSKKKNLFFIMKYEKRWRLWMFGVKYPIRMIFIDNNKKVIDIKKGVPITNNPKTWKVYRPKNPCRYILETPYDFKVKVGDRVNFK